MPRRILQAVAAGVATLIAVTGCAPAGSSPSTGGNPSAAPGEPIKLGWVTALSGGSAANGLADLHGGELAVKHINAGGGIAGRQLVIVSRDDKSDPATSSTVTQELIDQEGVVAVFGGANSGTAKANAIVTTDAGLPRIFTIPQEDTLTSEELPGFPLTFRLTEDNTYDVSTLAQLFVDRGYQSICAVADTTAYGDGGLATIDTVFASKDLAVKATARHDANATNMTAQVLSLQEAGCDSIYLYSLGPDAATFMKAVKEANWDVPVIGGRGLAAKSFVELAGTAADGIVIPGVIDPTNPRGAKFIEDYDAEYGPEDDPAHVYSAVGYDAVTMFTEALKATNGETGEALKAALAQVTMSDGVTGKAGSTLSWTATKHQAPSENYLVLYTIKDGKHTFLTADITSP